MMNYFLLTVITLFSVIFLEMGAIAKTVTPDPPELLYGGIFQNRQGDSTKTKFLHEFWKEGKRYFLVPTKLARTVRKHREFWVRQLNHSTGFYRSLVVGKNKFAFLIKRKYRSYIFITTPGYPLSVLLELIRKLDKETLFARPGSESFKVKSDTVFRIYETKEGCKIDQIQNEL